MSKLTSQASKNPGKSTNNSCKSSMKIKLCREQAPLTQNLKISSMSMKWMMLMMINLEVIEELIRLNRRVHVQPLAMLHKVSHGQAKTLPIPEFNLWQISSRNKSFWRRKLSPSCKRLSSVLKLRSGRRLANRRLVNVSTISWRKICWVIYKANQWRTVHMVFSSLALSSQCT